MSISMVFSLDICYDCEIDWNICYDKKIEYVNGWQFR